MQRVSLLLPALLLAACPDPAVDDDGGQPIDEPRDGGVNVGEDGGPIIVDGGGGPAVGVDVLASSVVATPAGGLVANGADASTITVTLVDTDGAPIVDAAVRLEASPAADSVLSVALATDASGVSRATLAANAPGDFVVTAFVRTETGEAALPQTATVTFWECRSVERYYDDELLPALGVCLGCHNNYGRVPEMEGLPFSLPGDPGARDNNIVLLSFLAEEIMTTDDGAQLSRLLAKPQALVDHGGGVVLREGDATLETLIGFVDTVQADESCAPLPGDDPFAGVELLDPTQTWRKARWVLTREIITRDELDTFGGTEADLDAALDSMLESDAFGARLMDLLADIWLTDMNNRDEQALDELDEDEFPNRFYFHPCDEGFSSGECCTAGTCCKDDGANSARFCELGQQNANEAVARAPLHLMRHVVQNDRSFAEAITADYILVNPYAAKLYGLSGLAFDGDDENDADEWLQAQIVPTSDNGLVAAHPHSGILSTSVFLDRYPTTRTNVNRHRARTVYKKLLDIDVMTWMQLVIDQSEPLGDDPFRDARTCSACHAALDPVAGTFQNWDRNTAYENDGWEDWMRPPAFFGEEMPASESSAALSFLATRVADDPRFASAVSRQWLGLLTGIGELTLPTNTTLVDHRDRLRAFRWQTELIDTLAADFMNSGYSLKELVKEIVRGPVFRARGGALDDERRAAWDLLGMGRLRTLTPEELDHRLQATLGYPWTSGLDLDGRNMLTYRTRYRLLAGGVDFDVINERHRDPFPIQGNVTRRMATEMACLVVPQQFARRDASTRTILRGVERNMEPEDPTGAPIAANERAIRDELIALHMLLHGERVADGDPDLEASYALFVDVWRAGKALVDAGDEPDNLSGRCDATEDFYDPTFVYPAEGTATADDTHEEVDDDPAYVVRAWRAVLTYLLADPHFVLEH